MKTKPRGNDRGSREGRRARAARGHADAAQLRHRLHRRRSTPRTRELAKQHRIALVPFLIEDFADKPDIFQPDRIHPTEAAQPLMLERVWKALQPLLK